MRKEIATVLIYCMEYLEGRGINTEFVSLDPSIFQFSFLGYEYKLLKYRGMSDNHVVLRVDADCEFRADNEIDILHAMNVINADYRQTKVFWDDNKVIFTSDIVLELCLADEDYFLSSMREIAKAMEHFEQIKEPNRSVDNIVMS